MSLKQHIEEYDIAKGIGILLVVIGHTCSSNSIVHGFIYSFHMPLFFLLSGLVLKPKSNKHFTENIKSDKKLLINYLFYSAVYIIFDFFIRGIIEKERSLFDIVWEFYQTITFYGISVLWFLGTLFLGKAIVLSTRRKSKNAVIAFLLFTVTAVVSPIVLEFCRVKIIFYPFATILRTLSMTAFIWIGYIFQTKFAEYIPKMRNLRLGGGISIGSILVVLILSLFNNDVEISGICFGIWPLTFISGLLGCLGIVAASALVVKSSILSSFLKFFGQHSLFIMATHQYLHINGLIDRAVFAALPYSNELLSGLIRVVLLIIIEVFLCFTVAPFIEKNIRKWSTFLE